MTSTLPTLSADILSTLERMGHVPGSRNVWTTVNQTALVHEMRYMATASQVRRALRHLEAEGQVAPSGRKVKAWRTTRSLRSEAATRR